MRAEQKSTVGKDILAGGGKMGALMRSLDWSTTAVGAVGTWPQSLKTAIRIILGSRYPMFVWWGHQMINFYNDAYIPILGQRHPAALGQSAFDVWADIWEIVGPQAEAVLNEAQSSCNEELLLIMERNGYPEETYFTFSYSPVTDDDGGPGGVFCAVSEETKRVLADRRLRTLRELAAATAEAKTIEDACEISAKILANNPYCVPFALLYLLDDTGSWARLAGATGLAAGTPASPQEIEIGLDIEICDCWSLSTVLVQGESQLVQIQSKFGVLPGGVWPELPNSALVLPLTTPGQKQITGFLIAGISPRREFDDDYKGFFNLIAGQITTAIASVRAYEAERQRAEALVELDRAKTVLRVLLQTHQNEIEYRIVRPDGSIRWVRDRGFPIEEATGDVCRVTGIAEDITDRKSAEEALGESEERFRDMADNAPVMVWVTDPTAYCTYLNKSWYDFSGQTEETGLGFGWLDAVHPQDYENSKNIFLTANERHEAFRLEYRLRRKDGEYRWAIDAASPWFGLDGQFKGYIGSVIDITERKHAEITVREAEDRLRLALESAELGTWDLNLITGELKWDNCCKAMFGLSPDAAVNYDVFLAGLHPDDRNQTQAAVEQATNPASNGEYDIEYRTVGIEDGVERWIAAKGKAVFNQAGEAVRFIGTVLNVTEKKRAEAEREQLWQREQAAREQAETANRIKDEFLAVLSHELRSPLNPILGWSSMLQRGKLDTAKTTQALATIERNAKLQVQLIDDLLDISRILRGKLTLTVAPVDLSIVVSSALETVRLAAEAKSLQIQTISSSIGLVSGDSGRLQQVVWNLLSNAVKFTPVGGQVTIELTQVETYAQIQVKDTGKGIHPNFLPHVFEHFRQEDGATTRKFGGLGLGLAIVRQIVEMHGGTVFASSPGEGQGATFTVQIPLAPKSIEMPSIAQSSAPTCDLSSIRVLVVDDDVDSRELIAFVLEQENAIITAVSSGADALQAFSQSIPNIVISDIGMPEIDGYMLIRQIRMLPPERGGCVPAIALTAYAGELEQQQALSAGFQRHIAKPIDSNAVVECVVELVRRRS